MTYRRLTLAEHFAPSGPKRILALDGGGLHGILTLGILKRIEDELQKRHENDAAFRLCHYFDLGKRVLQRSLLRQGLLRAKYDEAQLIEQLKGVFGLDTTLGSDAVQSGRLLVIKRLDSGSSWAVGNNPKGKYFGSLDGGVIGNGDYKLWQAVRASTAAPDYFDPERMTIAQLPGRQRFPAISWTVE